MAAAILTLVIAFVFGGGLWLALGPRLAVSQQAQRNDLLNLLIYIATAIVPAFVVVFYLVERL